MKVSQVLRLSLENGYLEKDDDDYIPRDQRYMCYNVGRLVEMELITQQDDENTEDAIHEAINGCAFLRRHLQDEGLLPTDVDIEVCDDEYKVVALKFWNELIERLEKEGK